MDGWWYLASVFNSYKTPFYYFTLGGFKVRNKAEKKNNGLKCQNFLKKYQNKILATLCKILLPPPLFWV